MFGNDYRPEMKLSIKRIKEAAINNLKMTETAALDFARFLVEQGGVTSSATSNNGKDIGLDENKATQAFRIMMSILQRI